jgi:hypothetical protein
MMRVVYFYFYTDSVVIQRIKYQALQHTQPFLLRDRLEAEFAVRIYPCHFFSWLLVALIFANL